MSKPVAQSLHNFNNWSLSELAESNFTSTKGSGRHTAAMLCESSVLMYEFCVTATFACLKIAWIVLSGTPKS